jgi:hypothetical protein
VHKELSGEEGGGGIKNVVTTYKNTNRLEMGLSIKIKTN